MKERDMECSLTLPRFSGNLRTFNQMHRNSSQPGSVMNMVLWTRLEFSRVAGVFVTTIETILPFSILLDEGSVHFRPSFLE